MKDAVSGNHCGTGVEYAQCYADMHQVPLAALQLR